MTSSQPIFECRPDMMKCTLFITQQCNLACDYCYIGKKNATMPVPVARRILDCVFAGLKPDERLEIGFFGGEPLLEFGLVREITALIHQHPSFDPGRVTVSLVTNGTIMNNEILDFLRQKKIVLCVSCDGPPEVQDLHRHYRDGRGSSPAVENTLRQVLPVFPLLPVNAVYSQKTLARLPEIVEYLIALGVRNIFLSPDISSPWTRQDAEQLPGIYTAVGKIYTDRLKKKDPVHISLIESKIGLILKQGYQMQDKCRMGRGEYAFAPSGNIYPCERLVGSDEGSLHCMGNISGGVIPGRECSGMSCAAANPECRDCGIREYCMNWCGCTNYATTGTYDRVSPFICASERAAIGAAMTIIETTEPGQVLPLLAGCKS